MQQVETTSVLQVVFDRYYQLSIVKASGQHNKKKLSRVFKLTEESPLPKQTMMFNVSANKK